MPVFYLDASAIAKMYLPDEQSVDFVVQLLGSRLSGDVFVTSTLSIVEVKSTISRRIDSPGDKESLLEAYDRDVQEIFNLVTVGDEIIQGAGLVVEQRRLRAGDAIHLATALDIAASFSRVFMVSADTELLEASEAAGIGALDPQSENATASLRQIRE